MAKTEDQRLEQSLKRNDIDKQFLDRLKRSGEPHRISVAEAMSRLTPADPDFLTDVEIALRDAFIAEFPDMADGLELFASGKQCRERAEFRAVVKRAGIARFQRVLDGAFGEGLFIVHSRDPKPAMAGTTEVIDPNPEAYEKFMAEYVGKGGKLYRGLQVMEVEVDGQKKWAILFY